MRKNRYQEGILPNRYQSNVGVSPVRRGENAWSRVVPDFAELRKSRQIDPVEIQSLMQNGSVRNVQKFDDSGEYS